MIEVEEIVALFPDYLAMGSSPRSDDVATLADVRLCSTIIERQGCDEQTARALLLRAVQSVGGDFEARIFHRGLGGGQLSTHVDDVARVYWVPWTAVQHG
jgi:hypothetical protein